MSYARPLGEKAATRAAAVASLCALITAALFLAAGSVAPQLVLGQGNDAGNQPATTVELSLAGESLRSLRVDVDGVVDRFEVWYMLGTDPNGRHIRSIFKVTEPDWRGETITYFQYFQEPVPERTLWAKARTPAGDWLESETIVYPPEGGPKIRDMALDRDPSTTGGVDQLHVREAWDLLGLSGAGVKVGVISDGADTWQAAACLGELPQTLEIITDKRDESGQWVMVSNKETASCPVPPPKPYSPGSEPNSLDCARSPWCLDEGTAMMEIIHDLAPQAEFAIYGDSAIWHMPETMREAMEFLADDAFGEEGADIIVDDLSVSSTGTMFRYSWLDFWVGNMADAGTIFVTSAGNNGEYYYSADAFVPDSNDGDGGDYHVFANPGTDAEKTEIGVLEGQSGIIATLRWDEKPGDPITKYELCYTPQSSLVCLGRTSPHWPSVQFSDIGGIGSEFSIRRVDGGTHPGPRFGLLLSKSQKDVVLATEEDEQLFRGAPGSISDFGAHPNVLAAGGVCLEQNERRGCPAAGGIHLIGSRGPSFSGHVKPDLVASVGVKTSHAGGFPLPSCVRNTEGPNCEFYGTSAAAPHVAGVAALVLEQLRRQQPAGQVATGATSAHIRELLKDNADDLGPTGPDKDYGYGQVNALRAAAAITRKITAPADTPDGSQVGLPVNPNAPDDVSYALGGADAAHFTIDPANGQLSLAPGASLTGASGNTYQVTITASQGNTSVDVATEVIVPAPGLVLPDETFTVTDAPHYFDNARYSVSLEAEPSGTVTVAVSSGNTAAVTVSPSSLTFTAANWDIPQTVTVTGVDDAIDQGVNPEAAITHTASGGGYDGITGQVSVKLVAGPGLDISASSITITEAEGPSHSASYTVALEKEPSHTVQVFVTSDTTAAVTASPGVLTFTPDDWNIGQTVTVTGVDNVIYNGTLLQPAIIHQLWHYADGSMDVASRVTVDFVDDEDATAPTALWEYSGLKPLSGGNFLEFESDNTFEHKGVNHTIQHVRASPGIKFTEHGITPDIVSDLGLLAQGSLYKFDDATHSKYSNHPLELDGMDYKWADGFGLFPEVVSLAIVPVTLPPTPNQPPVIDGPEQVTLEVVERVPFQAATGATFTASDPDPGDSISWSLSGTGAGDFILDADSGLIKTHLMANYEWRSGYTLTVTASDGRGGSDTVTATINVINMDDPGYVEINPESPAVGEELTATLTDEDGGVTDVSWQWAVESPQTGIATDITGATSASYTPTSTDVGNYLRVTATYTDALGPGKTTTGFTAYLVTQGNRAPAFNDGASATRLAAENTAAGENIGDAVAATDADGDTLTYSLGGTDAASFDIDASDGQLITKAALDYETRSGYAVEITAADPSGASAAITVTITVTDQDDEAPSAPAAPKVSAASTTGLTVAWIAPDNTGPAITGYEVRYRKSGQTPEDEWTRQVYRGTAVSAAISGLEADTGYEVLVRAMNDEGSGQWSVSGMGNTAEPELRTAYFYPASDAYIKPPIALGGMGSGCGSQGLWACLDEAEPDGEESMIYLFKGSALRFGFGEGSEAVSGSVTDVRFEVALAAQSGTLQPGQYGYTVYSDGDVVAEVSGQEAVSTDWEEYTVSSESLTGQLSEGVDDVAFQVNGPTSGSGLKATRLRMVVTSTDQGEVPSAPAAPTVTAGSATSLTVAWTAPDNTGPAITGYDLRYRKSGQTPEDDWTIHSPSGTATTATISGLEADTGYQVQVRASNAEGTGQWSKSGAGSTGANSPPVIGGPEQLTLEVAENTAGGTSIGTAFTATDADGDAITWTLTGADAASFAIGGTSGQLAVGSGTVLNYESGQTSYAFTVIASDGRGGTDQVAVTVTVTDQDDEAPSAPAAPTVSAASTTGLTVAWTAPDNTGPAITGYDLRYRRSGQTPEAAWQDHAHSGTATSATITGLEADTGYQVQVRASNAEGTGQWSGSGAGSTGANPAPPITDVSVSYTDPATVGEDFTVTLSVTGDVATSGKPYRWDHHGGSEWKTAGPSYTFASGKWPRTPGTRTFTVYVTGTDGVEYGSDPFSIRWENPPPVITDVDVSYAGPAVVGEDFTVTVSVTGDVATSGKPYRWDHHGGSQWRIEGSSYTFASGKWPKTPGTRTFTVYVTGTDGVEYGSEPFSIQWVE